MKKPSLFLCSTVVMLPLIVGKATAHEKLLVPKQFQPLVEILGRGTQSKVIVGAQLAVGNRDKIVLSKQFGRLTPEQSQRVNAQTLFCIGSCSKPFASMCVMKLVENGTLDLDKPLDTWLPKFSNVRNVKGDRIEFRNRPTVRHLLAHRAGIYSQKKGKMTPLQTKAIRDFTLSLDGSVNIIARQPLISKPGSEFAYSGAGYCVLGAVAEKAAKTTFEEILQEKICQPLNLKRTTYFPKPFDSNVAVPGMKRGTKISSNLKSPHLLKSQLHLPLIGGSIYSTAEETATFARMILNTGKHGEMQVLAKESWKEISKRHYPQQFYGLGWGLRVENRQTTAMSHTGSLLGYRSLIQINLKGDSFVVIHWTLSNPNSPTASKIMTQLKRESQL